MTFDEWWKNAQFYSVGDPGAFNAALREIAQSAWNAATKAEREACAELADEISYGPYELSGCEIGKAIRSRT